MNKYIWLILLFLSPYCVAKASSDIGAGDVRNVIVGLKDTTYFAFALDQIASEKNKTKQQSAYYELLGKAKQVRDLQTELEWMNIEAVQLAFADMKKIKGFDAAKYQPLMDELEQQVKNGFDDIYKYKDESLLNATRAIANKRTILLANPLLDIDKVVAVRFNLGDRDREAMAPSLGTQSNNWSNQQSAERDKSDADIIELSNLRGSLKTRSVFKPQHNASIADLKLHWDADRVMFTSLMPDKRWNVFEVKLDGSGYKPLLETTEPELEFYDGTWLPDGRIIANSNIGYQGVPCVSGSDPVGNMVLYNPQDKKMRRLTFDQDANWNPVIMHNGRVMYVRWEYTDLTHYFSRIVMHMNPDGTDNRALFGSGAMFPNSTFDVQPIPGHSSAFVGVISGHHGVARSGRLMLFDPNKARKGVAGIVQEIPHRNRAVIPLIKDELVNDVWPQFIKPTPLNDSYYLVSAKLNPNDLWGLYLVDVFDNVTCLIKEDGYGFISPIAVAQVKTPPAIPDRVKLDDKEATVFIQDIYEGEGLRNVPRGTVKELRVHAYEYAYLHTESDHYAQGIQSGWDIKRLLGTVPVEEDGSAIFKIPANTPVSIQPLDEDGAAVQWMRSWFTGMPGEIVSCVGCHEDQNQIPVPKRVIASQKAPVKLKQPEGGIRSFTFDLEVQPVLDRACVGCHHGEGKAFDLRGGKKDERGYSTAYLQLHPYTHRQGPEADMIVLQPYEYHPNTSELVRLLKTGHYNVQLTDSEWRVLYNWIDYNVPDKGYFKANPYDGFPYKGYDQIARRIELTDKYGCGSGVDWQKEIADYAAYLKEQGPITPELPVRKPPVSEKKVRVPGWPLLAESAKSLQAEERRTRKEVDLAPGVVMRFVRVPAGQFVMGSYNGAEDNQPTAKVNIGKSFWMAEIEVTNEQYNVVCPEHDSRYTDQQWKDHTTPGYPANLPDQPVIRVSYEDALAYCQKLSEMTGEKVSLPTEAQWEWACRAGSGDDFWFGNLNSDFSKYENMADAQLNKMAVIGVDPQPMSKDNPWYPYQSYLPKEESVDDGSMIQVDSKKYQANPFGLYSMHGNIAEWTRSDYLPYPYNEKVKTSSKYKVVRGGSYIDRPKYATAYARKAYYPWQRVHNVGFRVIIED
ncbi:formylglycine-generating enzyme required for sulfatase activity [Parabacteroides sp. PF5-5]|uniref:SUMF1/EgtB/PvdO family nonheme iron enzyme n=1 Tax=unclassified Parabacteroides TaxID=2649774 RepID=UPI002477186A|nr:MULTISPECIES: SUMF1/EgtB/PvdO family nonheme iron enzyme [unclassified Parabacteroides]MDH6303854.1 formylglycine-generating enzyme required for sulfatase activity [Parabacteroides sp. PH5-39]MDH6314471.1 formylglycine-generating enzyme required for sulfatase activity [Parabacteroides sp. PF5-13]MDH6318464.1 formylglycine-generating enzyme required for sulfatase activity [Parabacteroides sp. PH5-13]MDH6322243.1 formylglycine-generating enzyme required for sulfatase activity [Parabacteroides 